MHTPETTPIGRDAVIAALIQAAAEEFSERGYESSSIRAIARRARVNHGQVHRHFGSKAQLLAAVLADLAKKVTRDLETRSRTDAVRADSTRLLLRVLARALLDGADVAGDAQHPVMDWAVAHAATRTGADPATVRVAVAQSMALELGWLLFEPFLVAAAGLTDAEAGTAREGIQAIQRRLTDLDPS